MINSNDGGDKSDDDIFYDAIETTQVLEQEKDALNSPTLMLVESFYNQEARAANANIGRAPAINTYDIDGCSESYEETK